MALTNIFTLKGPSMLLLVLTFDITKTAAAPSPISFTDILLPSPNITGGPTAEIQCYALPYGAMGIISHLLTYWTIAWTGWGKTPLWPTKPMNNYKLDLILAITTLCTCIPIASITIHRCRLSWHFIMISIWKLVTSVSVACISVHRCMIIRREEDSQAQTTSGHVSQELPITQFSRPRRSQNVKAVNSTPLYWLILFLSGTVIGMIGLCSFLWTSFRQNDTIKYLTYGFAAPMVIIPALVAMLWYTEHCFGPSNGRGGMKKAYRHTFYGAFVAFIAVFGFFSALYGDLVLGVIADNIIGLPTGDAIVPIFWIWFIAKRLTLLSF